MVEKRVLDLLLPHLGVIIGSKKSYLNSSLPGITAQYLKHTGVYSSLNHTAFLQNSVIILKSAEV